MFDRRIFTHFDFLLPILIAPIIALSYFLIGEVNATLNLKQTVYISFGLVAFLIVFFIPIRQLDRTMWLFYWVCIVLLILVYFIGTKQLGAQRWIMIGSFSIQPSEPVKIAIILLLGLHIHNNPPPPEGYGMKQFAVLSFYILLPFVLILKQPDLGTTLIIVMTFSVMIFMCDLDWKTIIMLGTSAVAFVPFAYFFLLKDYQRQRVLTFLNPEADVLGSGWNVTQSMIAIGSGELYGKGFLNSSQSKLRFLPEAHTDFIVSVFLEERGFLGGVLLFGLYFILIMQILYIAETTTDRFGKLICYGIGSIFFFHFVINVGMTMGIMPVTGKPLLLMSYGGTSLLISFIMLGIVQSVRIYRD